MLPDVSITICADGVLYHLVNDKLERKVAMKKTNLKSLLKPLSAALIFVLVLTQFTFLGSAAEIGGQNTTVATVTAEAEREPLKPFTEGSKLNYSQFLGQEGLQGVYDSKTPRNQAEFEIKHMLKTGSSWTDTPGSPLIVGDNIYVYSSQYLRKYDLETGEELAKTKVFANPFSQFFIHIAYADGKIFVPLERNTLSQDVPEHQAIKYSYLRVFDAETLEQLYVTTDAAMGSMQTPLMAHDGYVVTGGFSDTSNYVCYTTADEDPNSPNEVKKPVWTLPASLGVGFSWNGAAFAGDCVYFSESSKFSENRSLIHALEYKTGKVVDTLELPGYTSKSTLVYNEQRNCLYVAANNPDKGASILAYPVNPDGTLDRENMKEWKSGTANGGTQSTPVIYNDRIYLGGGGGTMGSAEPFHVIDANTMQTIYTVDGLVTKGSAAISTAYATEENGNQVYIYVVPYKCTDKQNFWILTDREGQTEPSYEAFTVSSTADSSNFCSQTVAVAPNGYLVWYQDDKNLYICGRKDAQTASAVTAEDVDRQIARLAAGNGVKYYNLVEIDRVIERYNALSMEEQVKVKEYDKLVGILQSIEAVDLNAQIAALPEKITQADREAVQVLMNAYNKLSGGAKKQITNADKLLAAAEAIRDLDEAELVEALNKDIAAMPELYTLTSSDQGAVNALISRYESLSDKAKKNVVGADKLLAAQEKVNAIVKQMNDAGKLILEKLSGQKVTRETAKDLKEINQALEGLAASDLQKITEIEQYVSPAKVDLVNLLMEKLMAEKVNKDNVNQMKEWIADAEQFYQEIIEADRKYVKNYDKLPEIKEAVEAFKEVPAVKPQPENPKTGDTAALLLVLAVMSAAALMIVSMQQRKMTTR